jgi:N-methylhydantoinase A/oxoprolinase/acetone carboxylase beta subunit
VKKHSGFRSLREDKNNMKYGLGIDAGGTYTDAVIVDLENGKVIDSNKQLTTYPNVLKGIKNSVSGLAPSFLEEIAVISVSTTLATNTVLENTGYPVALILIGDHGPYQKDYPSRHVKYIAGGHDQDGVELEELDEKNLKEFVHSVRDKVSSFAISSFFSIRNPEHELRTKEIILDTIKDIPVVCGHELSQDIGAYERAVTAALNARLIPIITQFIQSIIAEFKGRGIDAPILMLKCDGSVTGIEDALKKPIETIFSGPAASLIGASHLSKKETCVTIDVGGTSTDVASISGGIPSLSDSGGVIGGWKTRVRSINMETSATGGDSHIWVRNQKITIGSRRVIPLCVAADMYPDLLFKLKKTDLPPRADFDKNIQPVTYYIRNTKDVTGIDEEEKKILSLIGDDPLSYNELTALWGKYISSKMLDGLLQKRLIQAIGFTPTDVLHVLGEYDQWNSTAASMGADLVAKLSYRSKYEMCQELKKEFAHNMTFNLLKYILAGFEEHGIEKIIRGEVDVRFKVNLPVVLIGGPVRAYAEEIKELVDAEIILPKYSEVGNAVGALFGKGIKKVEFLIKPVSMEDPDAGIIVFSPEKREVFGKYIDAYTYATGMGERLINEYMRNCGIEGNNVNIDSKVEKMTIEGWTNPPMETRITMVGIGTKFT